MAKSISFLNAQNTMAKSISFLNAQNTMAKSISFLNAPNSKAKSRSGRSDCESELDRRVFHHTNSIRKRNPSIATTFEKMDNSS
jgi:hypothetical protein